MFHPPHTAGIRFQTVTAPDSTTLPRMDIAGFVGFAARGPLDVPVMVEDVPRFRDIFGPDPVLAWDDEDGRFERAHLGSAVEAFFANGGKRAYVVRVAGSGATSALFGIPGLLGATDGASAQLVARSPGIWAHGLTTEASYDRRRLRLHTRTVFAPGAAIQIVPQSDNIRAGDLLELRLPGETLGAYLPVLATDGSGGLTLAAPHWTEPDPIGGSDLLEAADGAARFAAWQAASPAPTPALYLLRLTLSAQLEDAPRVLLRDLALGAAHPRWFGRLLPDAQALMPRDPNFGTQPDAETQGLLQQALAPRFPLAGVASANAFWFPQDLLVPQPLLRIADGADGLDAFSAADFLDPDLRRAGLGALRAEADGKILVERQPARGLHALWPVEEVALLALPDAAHRAWLRSAPPPQDLPEAPLLAAPVALPDTAVALTCSVVGDAETYRFEMSGDPGFASPLAQLDSPAPNARLDLPTDCPQKLFFRVRGNVGGGITPWSNTQGAWLPPQIAAPCGRPPIRHLTLSASPAGSPQDAYWLGWGGMEAVELEASAGPAFQTTATRVSGPATGWTEPQPMGAGTYLRVRSLDAGGPHPWSNTVFVPPLPRSDYTLVTRAEYASADLLTLHSAALRFCAARGDLTTSLSVPDFADPLDHVAALRPMAGSAASLTAGVPPLTTGERDVFSFGALVHPWLILSDGETLRRQPPDGAALGHAAATARERGAWVAAANRPVAGALGLSDTPDMADRLMLEGAGLNPLLRDVRGILTLSDWTLSDDSALRHMNIRRLLILLRRLALREGRTLVFEPSGDALRQLVQSRFDQVMERLFLRGAFHGRTPQEAFRVITDASVNPPGSVAEGRFIVELRVAPARPLAFLRIQLFQTGSAGFAVREVAG